jgi:hypothetical protein
MKLTQHSRCNTRQIKLQDIPRHSLDVLVPCLGSDEGEDVGKGTVKVIVSILVVMREDENKEAKVRRKGSAQLT